MRRLGVVTSPSTHADFYEEALGLAIVNSSNAEPQVTISGTADYAWTLNQSPLILAANQDSRRLEVTVGDACLTPITYSLKTAHELGTCNALPLQADLRHGLTVKNQDAIVTDAFLTQFSDPNDRILALRQWQHGLRLGGLAITTVQVRCNTSSALPCTNYAENIARLYAASSYPDVLGLDESEFKVLAQGHDTGKASRIYSSEDELIEDINQSGLSLKEMQTKVWHSPVLDKDLSYREIILAREK